MSEPAPLLHTNRDMALSFGAEAENYEKYRPDFPDDMMDAVAALVPDGLRRALDVGAGTGKAARALIARGLDVLAVEPDPKMAAIATHSGVRVEMGTFEDWDPRGRQFDLITFARSWHWVDPVVAVGKLGTIVAPGGAVALLSHETSWTAFDRPAVRAVVDELLPQHDSKKRRPDDETASQFTAAGFEVRFERFEMSQTTSTEDWLDTVFTYSRFLILDTDTKARLRSALREAVNADTLELTGHPTALIARAAA
ncbi:bifunctional 2-polyprenyl-6-hydroxyphenol methylase/3-demethylubiquinol 3-O-methyltransferase UbiG [Williamsia sp. CHRR-6]|uniref:class I SAM-dependent methyltransferase n=1 Tax=Williamsia sp. CHRR-6 TaxID=2835871 RepID=UPI001BDB3114|nr:class I SAM-dependent methyltransferase [Williamsia sp. CHRR-6]MBT0566118.1 class I SAM-dependent methyltransferase [Williamsia sp. CHRR-6]